MQRREFLKLSATAGAVSCITACGSKSTETITPQVPSAETMTWSACLGNCGHNCPLQVYSQNGVVTRIEGQWSETDEYGEHQTRACLRGRSVRKTTYAPDRLRVPLKRRPGTMRGDGIFDEISWEQAYAEIAAKTGELRSAHGSKSIYMHAGTGADYSFASANCIRRALTFSGGFLDHWGNYSVAMSQVAAEATYGHRYGGAGSHISQVRHSDLFLAFGHNPFELRMSGSGEQYDLLKAIEHRRDNGDLDVIFVDPRYTDSCLGKEDSWLPIRPGTDAALAEAMAYQMISSGWVEANSKAFLDEFCVGYDRESIERALATDPQLQANYGDVVDAADNYKDYVLGEGKYAGAAKTPAWAAAITGIPENRIIELANKLMAAKAPYIYAGSSSNRQANGEQTTRALYMLPALTGKLGQPGTNNGELAKGHKLKRVTMDSGPNPVSESIFMHNIIEAVERGETMTTRSHSVKGTADLDTPLGTNVKAIFFAASNSVINQQSDINYSKRVLQDESQCELIVGIDCWMTSSTNMADYILPATTWLESNDLSGQSYNSGEFGYINFLQAACEPMFESRSMYQIGEELCAAMGGDVSGYTEGRNEAQWLEHLYQQTVAANPSQPMPASYVEAQKIGIHKEFAPAPYVVLEELVKQGKPLSTPSGKIELYSFSWAKLATERNTRSDQPIDQIDPLGKYVAPWQGYEDQDTKDQYPLQMACYHSKGRTHSTYHNVPWLREAVEDAVWVNPLDASGFTDGQQVTLTSPTGSIRVKMKITPRVTPGVLALAEGAWHKADSNGIDLGGCLNTLTKYHPTPVTQGNPQHTIRVQMSA
ncbi:DMSO/selenate family reductase complex A subunit [uncultured Ferrimonas sp.]|uniref:DMSO/selenate family reductase complex A subunit n=1 Tax=uncultured Ferrimonas sp. TaxID=432640 RepID=UPI002611518D|nr:DMSO/selenate family reductase complex A subunit [uncultured Ferrimonas sp.]